MKGYLQSLPWSARSFSTCSPRRSGRSGASCRTTSTACQQSGRSRCTSSRAALSARHPEQRTASSKTSRRPSAGASTSPLRSARPRAAGIPGTRSSSALRAPARAARSRGAGLRGQLPRGPRRAPGSAGATARTSSCSSGARARRPRRSGRPSVLRGLRLPRRRHRGHGQVALALGALSVKKGAVINEATHVALRLARRACAASAVGKQVSDGGPRTGISPGHGRGGCFHPAPQRRQAAVQRRRAPGGPRPHNEIVRGSRARRRVARLSSHRRRSQSPPASSEGFGGARRSSCAATSANPSP